MSTIPPVTSQNAITFTGAIIVSAVVIVFFIFLLLFVIYLRRNLYLNLLPAIETSRAHFPGGGAAAVFRRSLHPVILKSLPVAVFCSENFKEGVECAVCLSELADGEIFRVLPACGHVFHLDCIDLWFSSNSTCPVCRSLVECSKRMAFSNRALVGDFAEGSSRRPGVTHVVTIEIPINQLENNTVSVQCSGISETEEVKNCCGMESKIMASGYCSRDSVAMNE